MATRFKLSRIEIHVSQHNLFKQKDGTITRPICGKRFKMED